MEEAIDEWADALEAWRTEYWEAFNKSCAAWRQRGEDEAKMRRLKKEYDAACAAFQSSDTEAKDLQRQVDEMLQDGESKGFTP